MKNKKSIAMAMAVASVVPMAAPAFAAEKTVEVTVVDVELANGKKEGATQEQISDEYQALQKSKSDLEAFSKATYISGKDDNGKDIVKDRYTITVKRTASTENRKGRIDVNVVNNLVDEVDDVKIRNYSFTNIDRVVAELPEFAPPKDEAETREHTISYNDNTFNSTMAKIKEAIKAEELKYEVKLLETELNGTIGKYQLTLKYDAVEGVTLNDIAVITITDAPIGVGGVNGEVLIPENNDFKGHWAQTEIKNAMLDKWIDASSTFRPQDSITRAEFVKIVNRAFNIPTSDVMPRMSVYFEDVNTMSWYYKDVVAAVNAGYINGYETTTTTTGEDGKLVTTTVKEFRPDQPITRQEAAKIIAAVVKHVNNEDMIDEAKDIITSFADDSDIAAWADQSVQFLKDNNISNGYKENGKTVFKPLNKITRAEAVVMMGRAINVK